MAGGRTPARRRRLRRRNGYGRWLGRGPIVRDAVTGFLVPKEETVEQRGQLVSKRWNDGGRDRPKEY